MAQGRPDWELIIIDDGSKDNTREVALSYTNDTRIRYHYQENKELNGARNTGVRLAQGTYCCFLDDDDNYEANHLEALSKAIAATSGNYGIYRTNMRIIGEGMNLMCPPFDNKKDALVQLWQTPRNLLPLAIKRDLLIHQPFNENDLLIDDFIWLNTALINATLFQADEVTANYIQHDTNRSKLYHSVQMLPRLIARLQQSYDIPGVKERVHKSLLSLRIQHQHMHLASQLGQNGAVVKALKTWLKGLRFTQVRRISSTLKTFVRIFIKKGNSPSTN